MEAPMSMSTTEYLAFEAVSEIKHEYWYRDVYAMAGASPEHNQTTTNLMMTLGPQWRSKGCRTAVSDQRVRLVNGAMCIRMWSLHACSLRIPMRSL